MAGGNAQHPSCSDSNSAVCSHAREPCSDELPFSRRRDCRQRLGRNHCHVRGALGGASNSVTAMWRTFSSKHPYSKFAALAVAVLWTASVSLAARNGSKDWIVLQNCRL